MRRSRVLVVLLVVLVAGLAIALGVQIWAEAHSIDRAEPGDCLIGGPPLAGNKQPTYERAACTDAGARFVVRDRRPSFADCVDVPGTLRTFSVPMEVLCIGEQAADPRRAINDVRAGECIVDAGRELPVKTSCEVPEHWRVLLVLRDVGAADVELSELGIADPNVCADARGTIQIYSWGLSTWHGPRTVSTGSVWDRVLCLGR